jgi:nicotinamidase-related amidase
MPVEDKAMIDKDDFQLHLEPEQCALMVIDIQERLMPVIASQAQVTARSVLMIRAARELGLPILATTQYVARIGPLLPPVVEALDGVATVDKLEFDGFRNKAVQEAVGRLPRHVNTLLLCGVETHVCVYQTVIGGLQAGFKMWVAADAVSSRTPENYSIGLERIRAAGGVVASTELIIYDLLARAGTPVFKALLPLLK